MTQQQIDEQVQACYRIEGNQEAFNCLKETVKDAQDTEAGCKPQLVLMVQDNCIPCKEEATIHAADIGSGLIARVDINSDRGRRIAELNGIDAVPALLILDCDDRLIEETSRA